MINYLFSAFETLSSRKRFNWLKTAYINLRCVRGPLKWKFPIRIYGKLRIRCAAGEISFKSKDSKLCIGKDILGYRTRGSSTITLFPGALMSIEGNVNIYQGASIVIGPQAKLEIGDNTTIGDSVDLICYKGIKIGRNSDVTWDCIVTDFKSHPIIDLGAGEIKNIYDNVVIGDYCWIGNRTTIQPGTKVPDWCIVTSNSLLNKDYAALGIKPFSMIGGMPARLIKEGVKRDYDHDMQLRTLFQNGEISRINISHLSDNID